MINVASTDLNSLSRKVGAFSVIVFVFSVSHSHQVNSLVETFELLRGPCNRFVSHFQHSHVYEFAGMCTYKIT